MDAATESAKLGAEKVILAYRRTKDEMKAYHFEYDLTKESGVESVFNVAPIEIVGKNSVEGVKFIKTETIDGKLVYIQNSEFVIACD